MTEVSPYYAVVQIDEDQTPPDFLSLGLRQPYHARLFTQTPAQPLEAQKVRKHDIGCKRYFSPYGRDRD